MSVILAILGLGFLIFIHELGHYFVARYVGMKVEAFGIGFGRPIYTWKWDDVEWRLCWLPFGGYVKIAGTETSTQQDPYTVPGGFFSKSPWDRIKVAFAGPFVNLLFALFAFTLLWTMGGRQMDFAEFTKTVGWVDKSSELYARGVRPGDEILSYDGTAINSSKDHLTAPLMAEDEIEVKGNHIDYVTGEKKPFDYRVKTYPNLLFLDQDMKTAGVTFGASFVIYDPVQVQVDDPLSKGLLEAQKGPQQTLGIQPGDRIVWADGEKIYSLKHLQQIMNDGRALITIERGGEKLLRRVPRVKVEELKLNPELKEELSDWQHESRLTKSQLSSLYAIPYNLTFDAVVENSLEFIDLDDKEKAFPEVLYSDLEEPLKVGDRIVAIHGTAIKFSYQLFYQLQENEVNIIVLRTGEPQAKLTADEGEAVFDRGISQKDLDNILTTFGSDKPLMQSGQLLLLNPIEPKKRIDLLTNGQQKDAFVAKIAEKRHEIEQMENRDYRDRALKALNEQQDQLILGLYGIVDQKVTYNPNPLKLFQTVTQEMWKTLTSLFSGNFSPKWLSGPVGIVQVVQHSWDVSMKEALFWLGVISLNLAYLNLLPIPVLDGGYICLFLVEILTRRKIKPQTMERLMIPFVLLLIGFFIYVTLHDLSRLFGL